MVPNEVAKLSVYSVWDKIDPLINSPDFILIVSACTAQARHNKHKTANTLFFIQPRSHKKGGTPERTAG